MKEQGMKRLADLIRCSDSIYIGGDIQSEKGLQKCREVIGHVVKSLGSCPIISVDNVADYVFAHETPENWNKDDNFPNVALPFNECFIEYRVPPEFNLRHGGKALQVGCWMTSLRMEKHPGYSFVTCWLFGRLKHYIELSSICLCWLVSPDGTAEFKEGLVDASVQNKNGYETKRLATWQAAIPIELALCFMHCKNVTIDRQSPSPQLSRAHEKRTGKPLLRYHVLNIEPMKRVLRTEGNIEHTGLKRALHICRGHFATYRDRMFNRQLENPVTVWRPMHVRGAADEGVVVKDYAVSAPRG